ncbi:MAG: glycosyltransferase [Gammaproteobacteria bacterium]|nr:glycosyltransferase [Gammaproteobacteria bacterium]
MNILMTCHDTQIDRRIIVQAVSLVKLGHKVKIMALSPNEHSYSENMADDLSVFRIGFTDLRTINLPYFFNKFSFSNLPQKKILKYYRGLCLLTAYICRPFSQAKFENLYFKAWVPFTNPFVFFGRKFKFDLIQCHDLPTLEAAVMLAKEQKVPLIYDSHELYPEQHVFSKHKKVIYRQFEERLIQNCDLVFTVNQSIAEKMREYYQIKMPVTLINAVDAPQEFDADTHYDFLRKNLNIPAAKKILLFQGGYSIHRQLETLIESMSHVKNHEVVLVLMGSGDIKDVLQHKAKALGLLNDKIYFHEAVPQDELIYYSASADMGIIPYPHIDLNSYYCTPNKLFEFIQARLPMIANDSPELCRFIKDQGFGMVHLMDSALSISLSIDKGFAALDSAAWKSNLKEKALLFSWKEVSQIYLDAMSPFINQHLKEEETCAV